MMIADRDERQASQTPGDMRPGRGAFTYVELLVALSIFMLLSIGLVSSNVFGVRMQEIVVQRNDADSLARQVIGELDANIRVARSVRVGHGDWSVVTQPTNGPITGNALELELVNGASTQRLRYYVDALDQQLKRSIDAAWPPEVVLEWVANAEAFSKISPLMLVGSMVPAQAMTNDASEGLIQARFELTRVGRKSLYVDPHTSFATNVIRCVVPYRSQTL